MKQMGQEPTEAKVKEQFDAMDTNNDGKISKDEFKAFMKQMIQSMMSMMQ